MSPSLLTVIIPTLNEETHLPKCLESLKGLEANILVVDSGSIDNTKKIAQKYGARFVYHPFSSFSAQREFGNSLVDDGWILSIEADVWLEQGLISEIKAAIETDDYVAYKIERINQIWGKNIMHTDWGPKEDCHIWLYKKGSGRWVSDVHEEYITQGPVGRLKERLMHHNYDTVSEFINKINSYSEIAARKKQPSKWYFPFREFFKRYIWKMGFLDGYHGLFLSYLQAIYHITLMVKMRADT